MKNKKKSTAPPKSVKPVHPVHKPSEKKRPPLSSSTTASSKGTSSPSLPFTLQQRLLTCFCTSFLHNPTDDSDSGSAIANTIQQVKHHLYHREFEVAFAQPEYRDAYAARWSAARTLGYAKVFDQLLRQKVEWAGVKSREIDEEKRGEKVDVNNEEENGKGGVKISLAAKKRRRRKVVCLGGGGGAEMVALAGFIASETAIQRDGSGKQDEQNYVDGDVVRYDVDVVDVADWSSAISKLHSAVTTPPALSAYASASVRAGAAARPLVSADSFSARFQQLDLLADGYGDDCNKNGNDKVGDSSDVAVLETLLRDASLVTLMFTFNELCTSSLYKARRLLARLRDFTPPGCLLIVVDSPGSYSSIGPAGGEKKYMMRFLLDYELMGLGRSNPEKTKNGCDDGGGKGHESDTGAALDGGVFERVFSEDSKWLRQCDGLAYPIPLEDMRVQIHLYEKVRSGNVDE